MVMGTCVVTLDDAGVELESNVATEGNYALCHWFFFKYSSSASFVLA